MASKFVLTAALKMQPPSASELDKIRDAIKKSLNSFTIPLKIQLQKNVAKSLLSDLDKVDTKLFQVANSFGVFARSVKSAFTQLNQVSALATLMQTLSAQVTAATKTVNTMTNSVNNLTKGANQTNYSLTGFNQALKQITGGTTKKSIDTVGESIYDMGISAGKTIRKFGSFTLVTSAMLSLMSAIRTSASEAIAFQAEVIKLRQVTGQSATGIKELTDEVDRLSTGLGVSSKELLDVTVTLAQAGLTAKDTKAALEAIAKASLAPSFDDMNSIVEGSIAILQQFKIKTVDLEKSLGSMSAVAAKFAVESADLITAVRRTGGAFQAAGGDLNELMALFTSVRQTTRESAESIATGFRTIFARLQRNRTQDFLKQFGISLRYTADEARKFGKEAGNFVGPFEAIRRLSEGLKDLSSADPRFAQIVEELGGFRQISKVIPLIKENTLAQNAYNVALEGEGSLTQDAALAQKSLLNQLTKVREEFQLLIRNITNDSAFTKLIDNVISLARSFIKLADSFRPILPALLALGAVKLSGVAAPFLGGLSSGLSGPSITKGGGMAGGVKSYANSDPHVIALASIVSAITQSFVKFDGALGQFTNGIFNAVSSFAVIRHITNNVGPFGQAKTNLSLAQNNIADLKSQMADAVARHKYVYQDQGLRTANKATYKIAKDKLKTAQGELPGLESAAINMNRLAGAIAAVAAISAVTSTIFQEFADAQLKVLQQGNPGGNRGGFTRNSKIAGGTGLGGQGAAVGAGIGGLIGSAVPGVGTAIGAGVGGLIGGLSAGAYGWINAGIKAQNILDQVDFNQKFEKVGLTLSSVAEGHTLPSVGLTDIRTGLSDLQKELRTVSDPERRTDLLASGRNSTSAIDAYLKSLSKTTKTLDEFKKLVGDDLLNLFSFLSKKSLPDYLHQIDETIKQNIELNKINKESIRLQIQREEQIKAELIFISALDEASISVKDFSSNIGNLLSFASGASGSGNSSSFNAIDTINSGKTPLNLDKFGKDLDILGATFGTFGKGQADKAKQSANISKGLPGILLDLVSSDPTGGSGNFTDRLEKSLEDKFGKGIPRDIIDNILHKSDDLRGASKDDTKILELFRSDPAKAVAQFTDVLVNQAKGLAQGGQIFQDKLQEFSNGLNEVINLTRSINESFSQGLNLRAQKSDFLSSANGVQPDFTQLHSIEQLRNAKFTGGFDANQLGDRIHGLQTEIGDRTNTLQTSALSMQERRNEVVSLTNAQRELAKFNDALKFTADASARAAVSLQELGNERSKRQAKLNVFTQFVGSDNAGRRDIRRNILAADNAVQAGNLNGVRQDQRGAVLSMIEGINPEKFKEILTNEAKALGIDPKGLITPGDKENALIEKVAAIYDEAIKAQELYTKALEKNTNRYITEWDGVMTKFIENFKKEFVDGIQNQLGDQIKGKEVQASIAEANKSLFESVGTSNIGGIQRLFNIQDKINKSSYGVGLGTMSEDYSSIINGRNTDAWASAGKSRWDAISENEAQSYVSGLSSDRLGISKDEANKLQNNIQNRLGEAATGSKDDRFKYRYDTLLPIIKEEIDLFKKTLDDQNLKNAQEFDKTKKELGPEAGINVLKNRDKLEAAFKVMPQDLTLKENNTQLALLNAQIIELNRQLQNRPHMATGGFIAGQGNRDNTLINTTPGEFVVRKPVAQRFGSMLSMLNKTGRLPHFANGGFVGGGGGTSALNSAISNFGMNINRMVDAFSMFPREISMNATHTVNVIHNGAQVFASLEPMVVRLIENTTSKAFNNLLMNKFPDAGKIADADLFNNNSSVGGVNFNG